MYNADDYCFRQNQSWNMNYLSHGYRFLDRPLYLAGTAVPDWLSVVNRRVRAKSRRVQPYLETSISESQREIANGIMQHHKDDDRFHRCELFMQLEFELAALFRQHMPDKFDHRPGFLGHIVVELMLDATLAAADKTLLDRFYAAMALVPEQLIEDTVNQIASRSTDRLAWFINRFREEKFLYDYASDDGMFLRLNQVLKRVRLPAMEPAVMSVLPKARDVLSQHSTALLQIVES